MRSDRRHELQTNELSVQIEKVSESVKQNATVLTSIIVGAIVVVGIGIWFMNHRANAEDSAWSRLRPEVGEEQDTAALLSQYESVARDDVSPAITRSAWLLVGAKAFEELSANRAETEAPNPERRKELADRARAAYEKVVANPGGDVTALGTAMLCLGVLEEDRGAFDKAREYYQRAGSDARLKETPFAKEAAYRLAHLDEWNKPIEFPAPVVPPLIERPEGDAAGDVPPGTFVPPADMKPIEPAKTPAATSDSAETPSNATGETQTPVESTADDSSADNTPTDATESTAPSGD